MLAWPATPQEAHPADGDDTMATASTDLAERIAALEDARYRAMIAGDRKELGRYLSDRLTYTHSTALTESKAEYLASVAKGVFKYRDM